jgi:ribonuclease G
MKRRIIVEQIPDGHRGAVLEEEKVQEWLLEDPEAPLQEGMIVSGKVDRVMKAMDAAFIDVGTDKHGYIHKKELPEHQAWKLAPEGKEPAVTSMLQQGQELLVQVKKEAAGSKGPTLTRLLSLPGSFLIYLPYGGYTAISKKLDDETRAELRAAAKSWLADSEGVIVRTNAAGVEAGTLEAEFAALKEKFQSIQKAFPAAPGKIYLDQSSVTARVERDFMLDEETSLETNDAVLARVWKKVISDEERVIWHRTPDLFAQENLDKEMEKSLRPFVWTKSGSSLLIEQTEAMTVIDVNSGKFTGRGGGELSGTALEVNKNAAAEIARQLRLRNIGGIVMIDFIDMKTDRQREEVLHVLKESVKKDRTITNVAGFTSLGCVEMTRKQSRRTLQEMMTRPCPVCSGSGRVIREEELIRDMTKTLSALNVEAVLVDCAPQLYRKLPVLAEQKQDLPHIFIRETTETSSFQIAQTGTEKELQDKGKRILENN